MASCCTRLATHDKIATGLKRCMSRTVAEMDIEPIAFEAAKSEVQEGVLTKVAVDLSIGSMIGLSITVPIHYFFGSWHFFVQLGSFIFVCLLEFDSLLKCLILRPLFHAEFFGAPEESQAFIRAGCLLIGYTSALIVVHSVTGFLWIVKYCWNLVNRGVFIFAISTIAGILLFGSSLSTLLHASVRFLMWSINSYYVFWIRFSSLFENLSESYLMTSIFAKLRVVTRCFVRSQEPETLPIFTFSAVATSQDTSTLQDGQFRLLHIHRRIPFLELKADLHIHDLETAPYYEAISYCWEPNSLFHETTCRQNSGNKVSMVEDIHCCEPRSQPTKMHLIVLNGHQLYVPANVYNILSRRSSLFRSGSVWIDSICINQRDTREKNTQVPLMKAIYERASHVYVCLRENKSAWLAFSMLNELVLSFMSMNTVTFSEYVTDIIFRRVREEDLVLKARMEALFELLQNRWFTRVWVFQEVVFARAITILYGNSIIMWEYFGILEQIFADPRYHELIPAFTYTGEAFNDRQFPNQMNQFLAMDRVRRNRRDTGHSFGLDLVDILRLTATLEATERVDKIFATLSCTNAFDELKEVIDYKAPLSTTLVKVANHLYHSGHLLDTLQYAGIGWDKSPPRGCPSWAVDVRTIGSGAHVSS